MNQRRKKANRIVFLLGVTIVAPLVGFFYYQSQTLNPPLSVAREDVAPFLMDLEDGEWFTNQRLLGKVTFLSYLPDSCPEECQKLSQDLDATLVEIMSQMQKSKYNEQNILNLQTVSFLNGSTFLLKRTENTTGDFKALFHSVHATEELGVFVFDRLAQLIGFFPSNTIGNEDSRRLISKLVFTNYMDDYLSRRTFFGVKKEYQKK